MYWLLLAAAGTAVGAGFWPRPLLAGGNLIGRWLGLAPWQVVLLVLAAALAILTHLATGDGVVAHFWGLSVASWGAAVVCVVLGSYTLGERWQWRWAGPDWLAVLVLLLVALIVRVQGLDIVPTTLSGDEGSAGLAAVEFGRGIQTNWFGSSWFSFPSLFFVVQYVGIAAWGQTIFGLRFMSAVAGACTVPAVYWLLRQLYGRPTAIVGAGYLAASHFHIHFSRIGLNNIWDGLFAAVVAAALWQGWQTAERRWYLLGGVALGLGQYFYVSIRTFPLLILLWAGLAWWQERPRLRHQFPNLVLMAYTSFVVFLPLGLFYSDKIDQFMAPLNRVSIWGSWLTNEVALTGQSATQIVLTQLQRSAMGLIYEPLRHWYTPGTGILLPMAGALFLLGLLLLLVRHDARSWLLLLPIASNVLLGAFSQDTPASQRYVIANVFAAAVVGVPIGYIYQLWRQEWPRWRAPLQALVLLLLMALMANDLTFYFWQVYDSYVLGGPNTVVATNVAQTINQLPTMPDMVYFVGAPRMTYTSHSTIPYLLPHTIGRDIGEPLTAPPDFAIPPHTIFIILPERLNEYQYIFQAFPGGIYKEISQANGQLLFVSYEVGR